MLDKNERQKGFGIVDLLIVVSIVLIGIVLYMNLAGPGKAKREAEWRRTALKGLERAEMNLENDIQAAKDAAAAREEQLARQAQNNEKQNEDEPSTPATGEEGTLSGTGAADSTATEEPVAEESGPTYRNLEELKPYLRDVHQIINNDMGYEFTDEITDLGCIVTCLKNGEVIDQIVEGKPSWEKDESEDQSGQDNGGETGIVSGQEEAAAGDSGSVSQSENSVQTEENGQTTSSESVENAEM